MEGVGATASQQDARVWRFGRARFDEAAWRLTVDDQRIEIETKPLALLLRLLERPGETVSKDALLDAVWPETFVVEASLTTAVHKLRKALEDDRSVTRVIETVPGRGYRIAVPVTLEARPGPSAPPVSPAPRRWPVRTALALSATACVVLTAIGLLATSRPNASPGVPAKAPTFSHFEVMSALRRLDAIKIQSMLEQGWNPDTPVDQAGSNALLVAVEICEWNPGHDRDQLLYVARLLLDGGARLTRRNIYGDTPYSVAAAPRYCGPDHPITRMLAKACIGGSKAMPRACLADYAAARQQQVASPKPR